MPRRSSSRTNDYLAPSVGWLFADLLLVLAVVFMISYVPAPTPASLAAMPTATPTPIPTPTRPPDALVLDRNAVQLFFTVDDPTALANGDTGAKSQLTSMIFQEIVKRHLQHRRAGIVIAYGGVPDQDRNYDRAFAIDRVTYAVLASLGQQNFVFCRGVVYYYSDTQNTQALYTLGADANFIRIDIFLFNNDFPGCNG